MVLKLLLFYKNPQFGISKSQVRSILNTNSQQQQKNTYRPIICFHLHKCINLPFVLSFDFPSISSMSLNV